jgi:hypothetical protein
LVFEALATRWQDKHQPVVSNRSRLRIGALLDAGWTPAQIVAAVRTIGTNPRNPSLLLETHLQRQLDDHQPGDYGTTTEWSGWDESGSSDQGDEELCPHGVRRSLPKGSCQRCTEFQQQMKEAIHHGERNGFTLNFGRRDEHGEREVNLIAGNVLLNYELDEYDQPYSPCVSIRHPNEQQLQLLTQCHGEIPKSDSRGWRCVLIQPFAPFPQVITELVDIFALPERRQQA